jgi:hypothetical protein
MGEIFGNIVLTLVFFYAHAFLFPSQAFDTYSLNVKGNKRVVIKVIWRLNSNRCKALYCLWTGKKQDVRL